MITLHSRLRHITAAASIYEDDFRNLGMIHIETDHTNAQGKPCTRLQATDGHVAIQVEHVNDNTLPGIPGFDPDQSGSTSGKIPAKAFEGALKICAKNTKKQHMALLSNVAVTITQDTITIASTNLSTSTVTPIKKAEGTYPDIDMCVPEGQPIAVFHVDVRLLARTLDAIGMMQDVKTPTVTLSFYEKDKTAMVIEGHDDCTTIRALIMPWKEGK